MNYDYTITTSKDFTETVANVEEEVAKAGFRVLQVHDIQETLAKKGLDRLPYKIIEFCNAKYANQFLGIDSKIGLLLPCKINVYIEDNKTLVSGIRPVVIKQFFPDIDMNDELNNIDQEIKNIINNIK